MHRRRALRAEGFPDDEVRRRLKAGELTAIRRGCYVLGSPPEDAVERHALLVRAEVEHLTGAAVVSHVSAAVVHGLPVWGIALARVHVTRNRRTGGRSGRQVHVHTAPLDAHEIEIVDGLPVTTLARTVVDLARAVPFEQAVVVADAALRAMAALGPGRGDRLRTALAAAVRRCVGWPGIPQARRVVAFADAGSESVGESRSRVAILRAGLPEPVLQWEVLGRRNGFAGRVDFGWPELCTVGEFDGRIKYGRLLRPGQSAGDAVYAEKLREDRVRAEGLTVVRWGWADLTDFTLTADRLRASFRRPS